MNEAIQLILDMAQEGMDAALKHLERELLKIRAGKASTAMLGSVYVDYYGSKTPLSQVSNIGTPDARTLSVQPWEKAKIPAIEKAIREADLGFNPNHNGEVILINIPTLTEDRRKELVKQVKREVEAAKVSVRNARKAANGELKKQLQEGLSKDLSARAEDRVQALTDRYIAKADEISARKEAEITSV